MKPDSCRAIKIAVTGATLTAASALADLPVYGRFQLQARSNFNGAYNLPDSAFFTSNTPALNDLAEIAIYISVIGGSDSKAVWYGQGGAGSIVYTSPAGAFLSDVSMNAGGLIVFPQDYADPVGIIAYNTDTGEDEVAVRPGAPFGVSDFSSPQVNDAGQIGFRGDVAFIGNVFVSDDAGSQALHAAEAGYDPGSPYSYLFTPSFNSQRRIAAKARLGAAGQTGNDRPDQIRVFDADGSSVLVVQDADADPASPYDGFDNSVSLNDEGHVAFIANLVNGDRGVFLADGAGVATIALESDPRIDGIEYFHPDLNNAGLVVFRAFRSAAEGGGRAIWIGDGTDLRVVVAEHDILPSDLGDARVDQHDSSPVFGGNPAINDSADVAFHCGLTPPGNNQIEWGSGLYVAYAGVDPDFNGDGVVNSLDFVAFLNAFVDGDPSADVNRDGVVNSLDFVAFLNAFVDA